jgi:hypothetical protein
VSYQDLPPILEFDTPGAIGRLQRSKQSHGKEILNGTRLLDCKTIRAANEIAGNAAEFGEQQCDAAAVEKTL